MAEQSSLVRLEAEFDIAVDWRGFELHPETPPGGMPTADFFPEGRVEAMRAYLENFAARFGIMDMKNPERIPNTRRALAMAEYARDRGKLESFRVHAMEGHWQKGLDIESDGDLRKLAALSGLDPVKAIAEADGPTYQDRVDQLGAEAAKLRVTAIPTFIIGSSRVTGCQPYELVREAAMEAGATAT